MKETGKAILQKGTTDENRVIGKSLAGTGDLFDMWAANSNLAYNRDKIVEGSDLKMVPAGQCVKEHFGDKYYSLSFTSYEGKTGTPGQEASEVPAAPVGKDILLFEAQ